LVFAAASRISVNEACQELGSAPTGQTVLGELSLSALRLGSARRDPQYLVGSSVSQESG
jgi:hypothetical protein